MGPKEVVENSLVIEVETDSSVGSHQPGDLEWESIFLFGDSHQRSKPRLQALFGVMCLIMGIIFIPELMEVRHRLGSLIALLCGM
mgnify:CR=1 FL=1